ncbi:YraN family protein [Roseovarius sp. 2305UL8-3]|uniref:YraN family protein n=1 Tax=Roseovarius conchicola TaxID=3121636 RepID=UPI003528C8F5
MTQLSLPLPATREERGLRAYLSGASAEAAVARYLGRRGCDLVAERWRGKGGEIDLILREGETYVFCEVKKARSFDAAQNSLRETQMYRIHAAASEYLEHTPKGQLSDVRFDLALVNETGEIRIVKNAFGHF